MHKKILPVLISVTLSAPAISSEVGSLPGVNDGIFTVSGGYYTMPSEWEGFGDQEISRIGEDIERDAPFVKLGYEFADDWYVSGLMGYERIQNDVSGDDASKLDTDRELFAGFEIKGVVYRDDKLSAGPFLQYTQYTDFSVTGPVLSNGVINNTDVELTDIYTASAGFIGQYQFDKLSAYAGAYLTKSEASLDGTLGNSTVAKTLHDADATRFLLGVNIPLSEKLSLDLETHVYQDFGFAVSLNYYPFKTRPVKKAEVVAADDANPVAKAETGPTEFENQIYFAQGSTEVEESEYHKIRQLARFMLKRPDSDVIIEGHCDCFGEEEFNQELSEQRALAVKKLLINFYSIPEDRIMLVGYGESFPIATNETAEGRQKNRRVRVYAIE